MRLISIIYIIFSVTIANAQIKNGKITYNIVFDETDMKDFDIYKLALSSADKLEYTLLFNSQSSIFYIEPIISDDLSYNYAKAFVGLPNKIYHNLKDSVLTYNNSENSMNTQKEEFLITYKMKNKWVMHNQSKKIGNYLCYKATTFEEVESGGQSIVEPVVAWYCPQIPFGYGPKGYGNLPGVILELQVRNVLFGAKIINFDLKNIVIEKPKRGELVTKEEFLKIIRKRSEN